MEEKNYRISRLEKTLSGKRFVRIDSKTHPVNVEKFFDDFVTDDMLAEMVAELQLREESYVAPETYESVTEESKSAINISDEVVSTKKAAIIAKRVAKEAKEAVVEGVENNE